MMERAGTSLETLCSRHFTDCISVCGEHKIICLRYICCYASLIVDSCFVCTASNETTGSEDSETKELVQCSCVLHCSFGNPLHCLLSYNLLDHPRVYDLEVWRLLIMAGIPVFARADNDTYTSILGHYLRNILAFSSNRCPTKEASPARPYSTL